MATGTVAQQPRVICLVNDLEQAKRDIAAAVSEIFASKDSPDGAEFCLVHALHKLDSARLLLENAPQAGSDSEVESSSVQNERTGIDWSDEIGTLLGRSLGEAMRLVTNELSTILAAHASKQAGYDETETWAALEQLRTRCGIAATWASPPKRDSEMRMRSAVVAKAGAQ
jgi:hypothetical protein